MLPHQHKTLSWQERIVFITFVAFSYILAGKIGLKFVTIEGISPFWPPSGLALGLVLIFGLIQSFPGLLLGSILLGMSSQMPTISLIGVVASNVIEYTLASIILNSVCKRDSILKTPKDILYFISISVFFAPFISSTVAITFLYIGKVATVNSVPDMWLTFWVGNSLGALIFTPMILSFYVEKLVKKDVIEALISSVLLAFLANWAFEGVHVKKFAMVPVLIWIMFRFRFRGASVSSLIVIAVGIWRSTNHNEVFGAGVADILLIQGFGAGVATVGYFLSTLVEAQETAQEKEIEMSINLQHKRIAEEALAILDQSIHKSPIGFALYDKDYKYIRINETLAAINGQTPEFHLGKSVKEVLPEIAHKITSVIDKVFETGESFTNIPIKSQSIYDNTKVTSGLISYYPVRHPKTNRIFAVAVSFQDISELINIQNLLRENQDRLRFSQEVGKIGAFEWDTKSNTILWTTELENIYGFSPGEFSGSPAEWQKCIHPEDVISVIKETKKVMAGTCELNHQFRIITKYRDVRWILARGKMVKDSEGRDLKFIGINIDLTEQKMTEQKLRLTETNLLHALSVRDEFLAIASHELKTPLTSLKLQVQFYQRAIKKEDHSIYTPEKIRTLLDKNSIQVDRLTRLVDDMLDISRIRTGKFTIKKEFCELGPLLKDIMNRMKEQFESSGSGLPHIEHMDAAVGEWDYLRMEQVFTNIITNSIRYGQGRPITISMRNLQDSVRITVKDNGLGIPLPEQQKIFERYERGAVTRERSGLGLGLFICKQIVDAHNGRIWVESEVNKGSTFYLDLPRSSSNVSALSSLA